MCCVSYQLYFRLPEAARLAVGGLGPCDFPAGRYVYTGSARRGFEARLRRHLAPHKTLRWHIDYLLAAPHVRITGIARGLAPECRLNQASAGRVLIPGFGASDCRSGCGSHLRYLGV